MEMTVRMPANYNLLAEEEMTYTTGGDATAYAVGYLIGWGLGAYNWIDMLMGTRRWYAANKTGNLGSDFEKGFDAWGQYTSSSLWNGIRSILGTLWSISGPIGWIGTAIAFATV